MSARDDALERAGFACEAMVFTSYGRWTRCGVRSGIQVHHALTRGRGGPILDRVGESYHLIVLCAYHHQGADGAEAYEGNLLIDGYVAEENGTPVYYGTDDYLNERYPHEAERRHPRGAAGVADHHADGPMDR